MVSTRFSALTKTVVALLALSSIVGLSARAAFAQAATTPVHGKITAVSSTSITIHNKKEDKDSTFIVTPSTKVKVDKVDSTIDKVLVGMRAGIKSADGKTADEINAHTPQPKGAPAP